MLSVCVRGTLHAQRLGNIVLEIPVASGDLPSAVAAEQRVSGSDIGRCSCDNAELCTCRDVNFAPLTHVHTL